MTAQDFLAIAIALIFLALGFYGIWAINSPCSSANIVRECRTKADPSACARDLKTACYEASR